MDSLEANFPHWFPKTPNSQEAVAIFKRHGDRGLASDEVVRSGNQVQCDATYLAGLLLEQRAIKNTILENPRAFGLREAEAFQEDPEPFVLEAFNNINVLKQEIRRLKTHPELFSDDQTRTKFLEQSTKISKESLDILNGHVDDVFELVRQYAAEESSAAAPVKPQVGGARREPWQTWCGLLSLPATEQPEPLKDFKQNHPEMILIGSQIIPHMGVLIAEHWRQRVEKLVVDITKNHPEVADLFPKVQKMLSGTHIAGRRALLKFAIAQPDAARTGHIFAFGPRDKVADLARLMARSKTNRDITTMGLPRAVMMGLFVTREEAKKFPHLSQLE